MTSAKYVPTDDEVSNRRWLLSAFEECSLGEIINNEKVFITEHGLVMGEFDEEEVDEIVFRLGKISEICGALVKAKVDHKSLSEVLGKTHAIPLGYTAARVRYTKQKVQS